jgi:hypothetical protein
MLQISESLSPVATCGQQKWRYQQFGAVEGTRLAIVATRTRRPPSEMIHGLLPVFLTFEAPAPKWFASSKVSATQRHLGLAPDPACSFEIMSTSLSQKTIYLLPKP